jgi:tetratricopeptide (TPR) repeat protein
MSQKKKNRSMQKPLPITAATVPIEPKPQPAAEARLQPVVTEETRHFFRRDDWLAAAGTFIFSVLVFFYHMAPEVTLQDSGELVTGAFTFGVPHPPGYPLWAFLGYIWSHVVVPFGNPAWRIGTMSVATGGLVVGFMTIMMTRSIRVLLDSMPWKERIEPVLQHWIALAIGISVALLFGFNRGVWFWACVSEMRVLNVFSFVLTSCMFFAWMIEPSRRSFLYATLFLFGLSTTNHQTIAIMAAPFAIGTLWVGLEQFMLVRSRYSPSGSVRFGVLMATLSAFWELTIAALVSAAAGMIVFAWLRNPNFDAMLKDNICLYAVVAVLIAVVILIVGHLKKWWSPLRAVICTGLFMAGCSFYLYMPLAASTNPPMNWGYAATKEGFLHAITRGQYQKLETAHLFSHEFFIKVWVFIKALADQYSPALCLVGLMSLVVLVWMLANWRRCKAGGRSWMVFTWAAFFATSLGLLTIINPKLDRQEQEITIKFFAPAHGFFAMLIGYGLALLVGWVASRRRRLLRIAAGAACALLLALPLITYNHNWSLCAMRHYDYGYLFGYLMFNPGGGYEPMERDAVLYGGTDPGRFVPTYMIFCESRVPPQDRFRNKAFDRSDVYIITQNALADNTYMNYIRDHYDFSRPTNKGFLQRLLKRDHTYPVAPIYIPSPQDTNQAFRQYVDDVQSGRVPPNAAVTIDKNGQVSVQGVQGVMEINGILAKWIFERSKAKHAFYVEESYVISWMYPYLRPAGVIMKLEKDPLPSPQADSNLWTAIISKDHLYWDKLSSEFLAREDFLRNNDAKKSFSKLRSAIAGIYAYRGLLPEAEYAFRQAVKLCPESPEASFRLADLYMQEHRFKDATAVIEAFLPLDPYNDSVVGFLNSIKETAGADARRVELESRMKNNTPVDINTALELASIYQRLNMEVQFQSITHGIISASNLPPQVYLAVAQLYGNSRRWDVVGDMFQRYLATQPGDFKIWIELAYMQLNLNKPADVLASLKRAVAAGGELAREALRNDHRFDPARQSPEFQSIISATDLTPMRFDSFTH